MRKTESGTLSEVVSIDIGEAILAGERICPAKACGLVLFAHGSGSSHRSPRNRYVASVLHEAGIATLLFDLLAPQEDVGMSNRFNIALLAARLLAATRWVEDYARLRGLRIGYFGASTGAAAAIRAAADPQLTSPIDALVCRGGRVDLAGLEALQRLAAPTLMIVGADDVEVVKLNELASGYMQCECRLDLVPGASHLFEEPGTLEDVAGRAALWFSQHLGTRQQK